jgi:hypothetical protein
VTQIPARGALRKLATALGLGLFLAAALPLACSPEPAVETSKENREKAKQILTEQDSQIPESKLKSGRGGPVEGKNIKGRLFQQGAPEQ